jgi:hypothetical protein
MNSMATKTATDDVRAAEIEMARCAAIAEGAERLLLRYETCLDANRRVGGEGTGFTIEDLLAATEGVADARVAAARATRAARPARSTSMCSS